MSLVALLASLTCRHRCPVTPAVASATVRQLHVTSQLQSEPLKKKKRIDPQVELERVRRKTRRIEKEIRRLEQLGRYLKPLEEVEGDRQFVKTAGERLRKSPPASEVEADRRALLMKEWTRYKWAQLHRECHLLATHRGEVYRAMEHLKALDGHLFDAAAAPDETLADAGFAISGPLFTPPTAGFDPADGDYRDATPSYRYNYEMDRKMTFNKKN